MSSLKIGFICGSLRADSLNRKLAQALMQIATDRGANPVDIDLGSYGLPLYHGDLDTPASVRRLIEDCLACDGIVIVSPEYNGSVPPVLKNAIDWTSTISTDHIKGPVYGIAACTPGPMSGIMCMRELQFLLLRLGADLVPVQVGCGNADEAFGNDGALVRERTRDLARMMLDQMLDRIKTGR
ncbi:MAG: NAD(P)H-dependent oxidoreductase [Hyphomonadaceae bacterium]|nr:NAD(P)H-dependent oxidoreductase [Hyphomonadaceae bacterium]MBC6411982.1 NAD(P)H-dependent oxidoreductase [Hyphomonadaceae bacterium]